MIEYLGWIGVTLFVIGGLQRSARVTMAFAMVGNALFIIKYFMQGHYSPFTLMLCNTTCALLILYMAEKYRLYLGAFSFVVTAGFIVTNFTSYFELMIVIAAFCIVWAQVNLDSYIKYKLGVLASQFLWIVYSSTINDYAMITTCLFILASNSYSLLVNMDKDIEDGKLVLAPSTAPYLVRVINVAKVTHKTIESVKLQFNHLSKKQKAPL